MIFAVIAVAVALLWYPGGNNAPAQTTEGGNYIGVLVYSPTCPHCEALIKYIDEKYPDVPILRTTDGSEILPYLKEAGVSWDGGVPIMVIRVDGNVFIVSGFPSENQNVDGYFLGKEKEISLCRGMRGTPYPSEENYLFCKLPDGKIIGNEHAIDWIMSMISEER